jgi:predicted nucleic acid-binding protein
VWGIATSRASSRLLYPEARATLASAARSGRVSADVLVETRRVLERLWEEVERIGLTGRVARRAGDLAEQYALSGYDAVHLASFELIAGDGTLLVTFDEDLRRAARTIGFTVAPASA